MRILQLVTSRQYRGAEVFASLLSEELAEMGQTVHFVGLYDPPMQVLSAKGCTNADLGGTKARGFSPALLFKLRAYYRTHRPEVIQANGSDTLKYSVALKLLEPGARIVYRNISLFSVWVSSELRRKVQEFLFRRVDYVTSVSEESRKDLIKTLHYPPDRIEVLRRGVRMNAGTSREEARQQLGAEGPVIGLVGKLSKEKNHRFLLEAFALLRQRLPESSLWFIGDGPEKEQLLRSVTELGLEKQVKFWGVQTDVTPFLAAADVLAITSTVEGIPGVILEGGMQGTPTVSVNVGGVKEVLQHERTGLLLEGYDAAGFALALERVLTDKSLRESLGRAAYEEVNQHYALDRAARQSLHIYQKVVGEA